MLSQDLAQSLVSDRKLRMARSKSLAISFNVSFLFSRRIIVSYMKITETTLRKLIREEISSITEDQSADTGKDIKGGSAADAAAQKLSSNKTLISAMDKISTADALASFIQDVVKIASQKGISQQEAVTALKKVLSAASSSK